MGMRITLRCNWRFIWLKPSTSHPKAGLKPVPIDNKKAPKKLDAFIFDLVIH